MTQSISHWKKFLRKLKASVLKLGMWDCLTCDKLILPIEFFWASQGIFNQMESSYCQEHHDDYFMEFEGIGT